MKQIIIVITLLLFYYSSIQAQVPGYQGKRFFIEIGGSFFPNLGFPTAQNKGPQSFPFDKHTGHFTIKDRYSLSLHYVIGRKTTFKAAYHYQVSGLNHTTTTQSIVSSGQDIHQLFYQVHMHDINLGFNLYGKKSSNLAPLGFYWDLGLRFIFSNGVLRDQRVDYADNRVDHTPIANQLNPIDENTSLFIFGITGAWGYRTVIAGRLILNFALETTILPQYALMAAPSPITGGRLIETTEYHRKAIMNAQDRYLLNLHIGIGALLF